MLKELNNIKENTWDSSLAECFYLPQGTVVELYGGTLHLAPCRVSAKPYYTIIVLPEGTNSPLLAAENEKDPLLFMNNKWLICHKDSPAVDRGGFIGITGENIQIQVQKT